MMVRDAATARSGDLVFQHAFGRPGFAGAEVGGVAVQGRAIGADDLVVVAKVEKDMRMIERRIGAHTHELLRTDLDDRDAGVIVKVRNDVIGHYVPPAISPCKFDTILSSSKALLSSGQLCLKNGTPS